MKVLWLCNIMLPRICQEFHIDGSKKEGWISGLLDHLVRESHEEVTVCIAFPVGRELLSDNKNWMKGSFDYFEGDNAGKVSIEYYGFYENTVEPWKYEDGLDTALKEILQDAEPDLIHCFGTEYPHTRAAVKAFGKSEKTLIGIQGLCSVYAQAFFANLPEKVKNKKTFRDLVKKDSVLQQKEKYVIRGKYEVEALQGAGHIAGRTAWDRKYASCFHKEAKYHLLRETLRPCFYSGEWSYQECEKESIFVSQGDYPIKGLHYLLLAMPQILNKYPNAKVYVAGNNILRYGITAKLKISAYGEFLQSLIKKYHLEEKIIFLGNLDAAKMKEQYLKSNVYLCPSSIENSPNSLGEAMLLKTPVVTADVGGIPSMISMENCFMYHGFEKEEEGELERIAGAIADGICQVFARKGEVLSLTDGARAQGEKNHCGNDNVKQLCAIYREIMEEEKI